MFVVEGVDKTFQITGALVGSNQPAEIILDSDIRQFLGVLIGRTQSVGRTFPLSKIRRFLEPGPIVLASSAWPLAVENLLAEHGRGIYLMKFAVDEVSFERRGTEVHIRKKSGIEQATSVQPIQKRMARRFVRRPWPGVRAVE